MVGNDDLIAYDLPYTLYVRHLTYEIFNTPRLKHSTNTLPLPSLAKGLEPSWLLGI